MQQNPLVSYDPEITSKLIVDILEEMTSPGYWTRASEKMARMFQLPPVDAAHSPADAMSTKIDDGLR
jgi:hypothetical protein